MVYYITKHNGIISNIGYYRLKSITIFTLEHGAPQKEPLPPRASNPGSATDK